MAKTVKISDVHYQMLIDVGKHWRMKPDDLVGGTGSGGVLKQEQEEMTMALNQRVSKDLQMQPKPKETTSPNPQKIPPEKFEAARFHWC